MYWCRETQDFLKESNLAECYMPFWQITQPKEKEFYSAVCTCCVFIQQSSSNNSNCKKEKKKKRENCQALSSLVQTNFQLRWILCLYMLRIPHMWPSTCQDNVISGIRPGWSNASLNGMMRKYENAIPNISMLKLERFQWTVWRLQVEVVDVLWQS